MAFDGTNLEVYDWNRRARDTAVDLYICRRKALGRTCAGIFLGIGPADMLFVHPSDDVEYVRRLSDLWQKGTDTGTIDLACCCLCKPFECYYLLPHTEEYE